ncbi:MAG: HPr family phosphocarrier protein [Pyrinomonas sp.]|uniref:HPr family phosphocarrier protein n=1 Tax=Pyrinomonas sp. TaxID=2080306 RepID=UPI0033320707
MAERLVVVKNRLGLHARAAAQLVRTASRFQSAVRLERTDGSAVADAKSILSVLMLAACRGTQLRVTASGEDEANAIEALTALFESGFGEEAVEG